MKCMLASTAPADFLAIRYPIAAEIKYDGIRCICYTVDGKAILYSRNNEVLDNFAEINAKMKEMPEGVYDGEIISSQGFSSLMSRASAKKGINVNIPIEYKIFDRLTLDEWNYEGSKRNYKSRTIVLGIGERVIIKNPVDLEVYYKYVLKSGHEGLILKELDSLYVRAKSTSWLKLKPKDTIDVKIINITDSTIVDGHIGYVSCTGTFNDYNVEVDVHSGFTKEQLKDMFDKRAEYLGKVIEVEYQELTKPNIYRKVSLRFPSFKCFRIDK